MGFWRSLFGAPRLNGEALATSDIRHEYSQIALLAEFAEGRVLHETTHRQRWSRVLPQPYDDVVRQFVKTGWLEVSATGEYAISPGAVPYLEMWRQRLAADKAAVIPKVRQALEERDTSEALSIRRTYEAWFPLGEAGWTGPDPQLSHSALTRRILFLDHWLLDGLSPETTAWLKYYAAEQHLWGVHWRLRVENIPLAVQQELAQENLDIVESVYWRGYQLALYVENQETWQRCKGGDHVRRIELRGPDDDHTCEHCRSVLGQQYLVARVPELPHRACTSALGCRCHYEPVLESFDEVGL